MSVIASLDNWEQYSRLSETRAAVFIIDKHFDRDQQPAITDAEGRPRLALIKLQRLKHWQEDHKRVPFLPFATDLAFSLKSSKLSQVSTSYKNKKVLLLSQK